MKFNKQRCLDNIYALAKVKGTKIGDLEDVAGVSRGYLSRINKADAASPSIETLTAIAEQLAVSVDYLLFFDGTKYSANERLLLEFLDSLTQQTISRDMEWITDRCEDLKIESFDPIDNDHPLFELDKGEDDDGSQVFFLKFQSRFDKRRSGIVSDSYHVYIGNATYIYIMDVLPSHEETDDAIELYLCSRNVVKPLCCTYQIRAEIADKIRTLAKTIRAANSNISLDANSRLTLQRFIRAHTRGTEGPQTGNAIQTTQETTEKGASV